MKKKNEISRYDSWKILSKGVKKSSSIEDIKEVLLMNREVEDEEGFFDPPTPFELGLKELEIDEKLLNKAVERVIKAKDNNEKVIVYGDYDADGITATAILWEALYKIKLDVIPYIPNRFEEGYGINYESFQDIKKRYPDLSLLITVDNGIAAIEDCELIQKDGVDVIITDHHQKEEELPEVTSIVHTTLITGAAIAWIFARGIYTKIGEEMTQLQKELDLAAIGTIADIAPLVGANRSFAYHGLKELNKLERQGLAALADSSGVSPGQIATYTVGFILAPRLNAMGRLGDAMESLRLLCSTNMRRIRKLANMLNSVNQKRQKTVDEAVSHALEELGIVESLNSLVISDKTYHEGVIGLVASKLVERYYLPSIVLSEGDELSKASARSISGFNIIESIRELDHLIEGGGGHPMAAGFTIKTENIPEFVQEFDKIASERLSDEIRKKELKVDMKLKLTNLSKELYKLVNRFNPVGPGNPTPSFLTEKLSIKSMKAVGKKGNHLKLILSQEKKFMDAIAFGFGDLSEQLKPGEYVDVIYNLDENRWNGNVSLQMKIKDIRHHE